MLPIPKENDDGWETIDTDNTQSKQEQSPEIEIEKVRNPEARELTNVEHEIEIEQDPVTGENQDPEELRGISTKGAEKRIRKLVAQRKERDEQITLAMDKIRYLENVLYNKDRNISDYQQQSIDLKKDEISRRVESAQMSFSRAFDDGDKDTLVKSQTDLSKAQAELQMLEYAVMMNPRSSQEPDRVQQPQQRPAPQQRFDAGAVEWAEKNAWFGKDRIGTSIALAMDHSLKEEGFDPRDDDFYEELDKRLSKELPARLRPSGDVKTTQVVAGQSRRQASSNKVRLTQADVNLAKKWGLTLERYAAEKKKAERSAGDYTLING